MKKTNNKMQLLLLSVVPVSYTHLDVYKRQVRTLRSSKSCIACFWVMALFTLIA